MAYEREANGERLSRRALLGASLAAAVFGRGAAQAAAGRTFYVATTGNDSNDGSQLRPFRTINGAFRRVSNLTGGDTIMVMPGTYQEAVNVKAGGNATADLRLVSQTPRAAQIRSPAGTYSAINIQQNYVTVEGFDVRAGGTGHAIEATFLNGDTTKNGPHHITIRNNICHDSAGSGIGLAYGDYYLIEDNVCFNNCATNQYQGSGISVYSARAVPGTETTRVIIRRNTVYSNMALVLPGDVPHSDGNGIIVDDFRNTQTGYYAGVYPYTTLVENNVCWRNGGKGVHVFLSNNVIVRNNTCCFNNRDPKNPATWRGELSNVNSSNVTWVNNIGVADRTVNSWNRAILSACSEAVPSKNVFWYRNLSYEGTAGAKSINQSPANATLTASDPYRNLLGVAPGFVRGGPGDLNPDYRLLSSSAARNAGTTQFGISTADRLGEPRVAGTAPDLGAYEYQG